MKKALIISVLVLLVVGASVFGGYRWGYADGVKSIVVSPADTVVITDTIHAPVPEPKVIEKVRIEYVQTLIPGETKVDTVFTPILIEQKEYQDSLYRAYVSGYRPNLDSIIINAPTTYITKTIEKTYKPKLAFGAQAGVGLVLPFKSTPAFGGYIGLGLQYTF